MGLIDPTLQKIIAVARDKTAEVSVVLLLSEPCDDRQKQSINDCGLCVTSVSGRVVTGTAAIGKIVHLSYLPYVKKIKLPTEHYLMI